MGRHGKKLRKWKLVRRYLEVETIMDRQYLQLEYLQHCHNNEPVAWAGTVSNSGHGRDTSYQTALEENILFLCVKIKLTSLDATMTRSGPGRHVLYCFDTKCDLKWVLVRIAAFCCAHRPQILIPEIL